MNGSIPFTDAKTFPAMVRVRERIFGNAIYRKLGLVVGGLKEKGDEAA